VPHPDRRAPRDTEAYEQAPWGLDENVRPESCETLPKTPEAEPTFRSELTPEGEQLVIPGCERNRSKTLRQLDLFG